MKLLHLLAALLLLVSFASPKKLDEKNDDAAAKEYDAGVTAQNRKNYDGAIHHYQQAIILRPDFADAFNNMGFCYRMMAKSYLNKAGDAYQRALRIQPDHVDALEYQGEYWIMRGDLMKAYRNYQTLKTLNASEARELKRSLDTILDQARKVEKASSY